MSVFRTAKSCDVRLEELTYHLHDKVFGEHKEAHLFQRKTDGGTVWSEGMFPWPTRFSLYAIRLHVGARCERAAAAMSLRLTVDDHTYVEAPLATMDRWISPLFQWSTESLPRVVPESHDEFMQTMEELKQMRQHPPIPCIYIPPTTHFDVVLTDIPNGCGMITCTLIGTLLRPL